VSPKPVPRERPDLEPDVFDPNLAPVVFDDVVMAEAWVLSYRSPIGL
jgi:hypothetical protein